MKTGAGASGEGDACCVDETCTPVTTPEACFALAGIFYPGVPCVPNPCVCDDAGVSVTLVCDSIFAERQKCGFTEFSGFASTPPKYYLQREFHVIRTDFVAGTGCTMNWDLTTTQTYTLDEDGSCGSPVCSCSGSTTGSALAGRPTCSWIAGGPNCGLENFSGGCQGGTPGCPTGCVLTCLSANAGGPTSATTSVETCDQVNVSPPFNAHFTDTITLSDEYTTDELIAQVEEALPTYSGLFDCDAEFAEGQGCDCVAFRYLSDDDPSFTGTPFFDVERFNPKFKFAAQVFNFKIKYIEHTVFDAGGEQSIGRILTVTAGMTEIQGPEVWEPDENGYTEINTSSIKACL
jgi:hypothetical protein